MSRIYVQDPISVSYFILPTRHGDIKILLFGEWHKRKTQCFVQDREDSRIMSLPIFLRLYQSRFADTMLDLFVESTLPVPSKLPAKNKNTQKKPSWDYGLGYLRQHLDRCAPKFFTQNLSKTYECPHNLRVHLCDIRQISIYPFTGYSKKQRDVRPFALLAKYFDYSHVKASNIKDFPSFLKFWDATLNNPSSDHYIDKIFDMSMTYLKIVKQIDHIRSKRMRKILIDWGTYEWVKLLGVVRDKWKKVVERYESRTMLTRIRQAFSGSVMTAVVTPFLNSTIDLNTILMDMYVMGRILRTFSDGTTINHAIVYTGEFHSFHYRAILRLLGAQEIFTSSAEQDDVVYNTQLLKSKPSCVDVSPLFSLGLLPSHAR